MKKAKKAKRAKFCAQEAIIAGMSQGRSLTIEEWAEDIFKDSSVQYRDRISSALYGLRKKGNMFYPLEKNSPVVDVSKDLDSFFQVEDAIERKIFNRIEGLTLLIEQSLPILSSDIVKEIGERLKVINLYLENKSAKILYLKK